MSHDFIKLTQRVLVIPRLHDEAGSTSWLYDVHTSSTHQALINKAWRDPLAQGYA